MQRLQPAIVVLLVLAAGSNLAVHLLTFLQPYPAYEPFVYWTGFLDFLLLTRSYIGVFANREQHANIGASPAQAAAGVPGHNSQPVRGLSCLLFGLGFLYSMIWFLAWAWAIGLFAWTGAPAPGETMKLLAGIRGLSASYFIMYLDLALSVAAGGSIWRR